MNPLLAALGAGMGEFGAMGLDEKRRLRALQQAQAQMDAETQFRNRQMDLEESQLGESKRHNEAMEAFRNAELGAQTADREELRERQRLTEFRSAGKDAGVNYLNPELAYANSKQVEPEMGGVSMEGGAVPDLSSAMNALRQANSRSWQGNLDSTAGRLANENVGAGFVRGSEGVGGVVLENKQHNPFAMMGANVRAGVGEMGQESTDFRAAMDDILNEGDKAYNAIKSMATTVERIQDTQGVEHRATQARERARRDKARAWSLQMQQRYPQKAHLYTVERLLGDDQPAPRTTEQGDPLGIGVSSQPPQPQTRPTAPRTAAPQNNADPLGLFSPRP